MRYKYCTIQYCTAIGVTLIIDKYDWVSFFIGSETISVSFFLFLRAGYSHTHTHLHTHTYRYMHSERVRKRTQYIYWYIYSTSLFSRSIIIILYTRLRIKARRRLLQYTMEIHVDGKIKKKNPKRMRREKMYENVNTAWWRDGYVYYYCYDYTLHSILNAWRSGPIRRSVYYYYT